MSGEDFVEGVEEGDGAVVGGISRIALFVKEEDICMEP